MRPWINSPLPQARARASSSLSVKNIIEGHQLGGEWGRYRGDLAQEGVQTTLVVFFIFALQAIALDILAAFDVKK